MDLNFLKKNTFCHISRAPNWKGVVALFVCYRWEASCVSDMWESLQPELQPHHTQPQAQGWAPLPLYSLPLWLPAQVWPAAAPTALLHWLGICNSVGTAVVNDTWSPLVIVLFLHFHFAQSVSQSPSHTHSHTPVGGRCHACLREDLNSNGGVPNQVDQPKEARLILEQWARTSFGSTLALLASCRRKMVLCLQWQTSTGSLFTSITHFHQSPFSSQAKLLVQHL